MNVRETHAGIPSGTSNGNLKGTPGGSPNEFLKGFPEELLRNPHKKLLKECLKIFLDFRKNSQTIYRKKPCDIKTSTS